MPYIFTVVKGYTQNHDFQKDLIQEIFAKVFLNIRQYDPTKGPFKPWIRKVAVNQCLMFLRSKVNRLEFEDVDQLKPSQEPAFGMDLSHLDPQLAEQLLAKMPEGYRQVFSMVILDGFSHKEVGEQLGISPDTSRSQLARSKKWLRSYVRNNQKLGVLWMS